MAQIAYSGAFTRTNQGFPARFLGAMLLSAGLMGLLLWPSGLVQAQDSNPPPVQSLRCIAETDRVAFLWDAPEWAGGEVYGYDYRLTLPDGREESGRLGQGITLVLRPGSYQKGKAASVSVTTIYETSGGREVLSAAATLTCYVGGEPETPNQAPTVSGAIADATIVNESGTQQVSLAGVFDDADNDSLTITAASSDEAVATVSVASDQSGLTVRAQARGIATITATADDGRDGTVSDAFTVTVKAAPVVASPLADISGLEVKATREVSLAGAFSDADNDALTMTAASGDEAIATVSVAADQSKLTVAAVSEGTATITATAQDADGNTVSDAFDVLVVARPQQQQQQSPALSSDATLSGLALLRDGSGIPLRPAFDPQTAQYAATVPLGNGWASLRPTANHAGSTITVDGKTVQSGSSSEAFFLEINTPKRVVVSVTAEDGKTRREYAVTATHAPRAELSGLSISQVKLHPFFSGLHTDYRGWVAHGVASVRVTPTNRYAKGTITVNGQTVASGAASPAIALAQGSNVITVTITAPDDYTSRSYTITVERASAAASGDATLSGLAVHRATSNQPDAGNNVPYAGDAYTLTPAFTAGVYDYRVRVPEPSGAERVYLTTVATTTAPGAKSIVVSGKSSGGDAREPKGAVVTGEASGPWQTFLGYGLITIAVTSLDGSSVQTYRVLVEQGNVDDPQGVAVAPGDGSLTLSWGEPTGSNPPELYWARWREAGTTTWLNRATLSGWKTSYGDDAAAGTAADGQRMPTTRRAYTITGLTNGREYEVELRGTRGGDTIYGVTNWLKSEWVAARGTPGQPATALTITPSSATREYGGTDDLSYTVGGLVDGDAAGDVVTGALSRAAGDDAGSYAIGMGTLAVAAAYADKYTLPAGPAVTTYTIAPRTITAVSGVTVTSRPADGSAAATFDTSAAQGVGVLAAELADFRSGGLVVSGVFPAATPGTHDVSVTYSLQDSGTFKAANYALSAATDTLQGQLTEVAACGYGLMLGADGAPAEGGAPVTVTAVLSSPAGPGGLAVTLTTGGTATVVDDYTLSTATVNIAAGATAGASTIIAVDDNVDDDGETIILNAAASASSLTASPLTLTITDNDDRSTPTPVANAGCTAPAGGDYDVDDDGLIEVCNVAQLKAIHADLNGDGSPISGPGIPHYAGAFPNAVAGMGCPQTGCVGYELVSDLDIGNLDRPCEGRWSNEGNPSRFYPIGGWGENGPDIFSAIFEGNGFTIRNYRVSGFYPGAGLFSVLATGGVIRNIRLESANVEGRHRAGGLVGINHGTISNVHSTGCVAAGAGSGGLVGLNSSTGIITGSSSAGYSKVVDIRRDGGRDAGGLVGHNAGSIRGSYSTAEVVVDASDNTGGLVGYYSGSIRASYATGGVLSRVMHDDYRGRYLGSLVGVNHGDIIASYSTGRVSQGLNMGGLVGVYGGGTVTASYWNTETSGMSFSRVGTGKTTEELQAPTGYTGIYADWNVDVDGDDSPDDPWDFGKFCQYPVLKYGGLDPADQRAPCTPATTTKVTMEAPTGTGKELLMPPCEPDPDRQPTSKPGVIAFIMCADHLTIESVSTASDITFYPEFTPDRHHYVVHVADSVTELKVIGDFRAGFPIDIDTYTTAGFAWAFADGQAVVNRAGWGGIATANNTPNGPPNAHPRWVTLRPGVTTIQIGGARWFNPVGPSESEAARGQSSAWTSNSAKIARKTYTLQLVWQSPSTALEAPVEPAAPPKTEDYDTDDDGLIEVSSLAQLDAVRWDVNGDGYSDHGGPLHQGFPNALDRMGCPHTGCIGYELIADLDFDTNGNGRADAGDAYWNSGYGWLPIGIDTHNYSAVFEGNGHLVRNLHINSTARKQSVATEYAIMQIEHTSVGMFEAVAPGGVIRNVGLESVNVSRCFSLESADNCVRVGVGGLAGENSGEISNSYVTGAVSNRRHAVGGLVGINHASGVITGSYATASVTGTDSSGSTYGSLGGLVGQNDGAIKESYATGALTGRGHSFGGLVGLNTGRGSVTASFATGGNEGDGYYIGGLVGQNAGTVTAVYATGRVTGSGPVALRNTGALGALVGHNSHIVKVSYALGRPDGILIGSVVDSSSRIIDSYSYRTKTEWAGPEFGAKASLDQLRQPTGYTGIYANWNLDLDGDSSVDDPWDFGTSSQFPMLKINSITAAAQRVLMPNLSANQPPTVVSAIADSTIVNLRTTRDVDLSGVFNDADNDPLTITTASSNEAVATVSKPSQQLLNQWSSFGVTARSRGQATITVTADDGRGGTVADTFDVTVKAAPTVATALADISGLEVDATQDVSLSGVFHDADGDSLTITAASSDETKAIVTVASDGSKLMLTGVGVGTTTVTVTAQDADGNVVSDAFDTPVARKYSGLIAQMYQWRNDSRYVHDKAHTDRWDRALLAFGETVADTTLTIMTAAEAQGYADRGWSRWVEVAAALRELEADRSG